MIKTEDDYFEDLAKSYPELIERSKIGESLGVDVGWFNIINVLCGEIYNPVQRAKQLLKAAIEYPRDDAGAFLKKAEDELAEALAELPEIVQIKEKFGTLRFYCYGGSERVHHLIEFAESMSGCTCEKCGAPGKKDTEGWIKTHCIAHRRANPNDEKIKLQDGKISPHFDSGE